MDSFLLSTFLSSFFSPITKHVSTIPATTTAKRCTLLVALTAFLTIGYTGWAYHLDLQAIRHLDDLGFWRPGHVRLGAKSLDRFGRMKRSSGVPTLCGEEYSDFAKCVDRAHLQANCLSTCPLTLTCGDCQDLLSIKANRLSALLVECDDRKAALVPLQLGPDGQYSYALFSLECSYVDPDLQSDLCVMPRRDAHDSCAQIDGSQPPPIVFLQ